MANKKNLAAGIVANDPGTAGTSLVLDTGYGQFMPTVPFFMTLTPPGQLSTLGNSEIVDVTDVSNDTLTITREQKGTTAKDIAAGWVAVNGIYVEDMEGGGYVAQNTEPSNTDVLWVDPDDDAPEGSMYGTFNLLYPIGTIYTNKTDSRNPSDIFGYGTWTAITDRFVYAAGSKAAGTTGGAETHTLTTNEMPAHTHTVEGLIIEKSGSGTSFRGLSNTASSNIPTQSTGGGAAHNNMPPYLVAYMWERTA